MDVKEKNIEYNGIRVTDIELKENKNERGPFARTDITINDTITEYNIPVFENNGKLSIGDKKQYINGKNTGFNEMHIRDQKYRELLNSAVTEVWEAMIKS